MIVLCAGKARKTGAPEAPAHLSLHQLQVVEIVVSTFPHPSTGLCCFPHFSHLFLPRAPKTSPKQCIL